MLLYVLLYTRAHLTNNRGASHVPIQYFTILDRNLLDSCESWPFSCFFNPFQMFCQFQTHDKRYGRIMKRIWDINTVFSTSFVQWRSYGGDWGGTSPPTLLHNHFRDMFKSVEKLGGGVTLTQFHVQIVIRSLIIEDAGILTEL
jgi:hypothetical protein